MKYIIEEQTLKNVIALLGEMPAKQTWQTIAQLHQLQEHKEHKETQTKKK